jgi:two-component system KDP operon response regulator KdpE
MSDSGLKILIVDDERAIRRFLRASLTAHGYTVQEAVSGEEAMKLLTDEHPDLLILDVGLSDINGIEVTRRLREWSEIPVIILSVRDQEGDKIAALDAGADDYLTKPFGVGELLARIRVALRRAAKPASDPIFQADELVVDFTRRVVMLKDNEISLTPIEYDLLRALVQNAGKVMTHRQLIRAVWGAGYEEESHLLRVNISNLRHKIEPDPTQPRFILTEPGVGYRFRA